MRFSDLYKVISEENEYEDWTDYLYYNSIEKDKIDEFAKNNNISFEFYLNSYYLKFYDSNNSIWLEYDSNNDSYDQIEKSDSDMANQIDSIPDHLKLELLKITEDDIYIDGWECRIGELREYGGTVYHYTTEEGWENIQKSKEMRGSYGTGITNRSAYGIFTSIDPEEHAIGTYGDVCLEIDLTEFKKKIGIEKLNLDPEPDVLDYAINNSFASALDLSDEYTSEVPSDMSIFTVIVNHNIPLEFIKRLN